MDAIVSGQLEIVLSPELYLELEGVLGRPKLAARIAMRRMTPASLLATVSSVAEVVFPEPLIRPASLRDANDLHVLECAVSAKANAIITGDKDLLAIGPFAGIPILDVGQALEAINPPANS
jgi:putative PIN family toxin of toxin-antitoxin system